MDPNQLFAQALRLPHPWTVTSSALEGKPKKLTLTVDLRGARGNPSPYRDRLTVGVGLTAGAETHSIALEGMLDG